MDNTAALRINDASNIRPCIESVERLRGQGQSTTRANIWIMDDEYEVIMSPLCQEISSGGSTIQVEIYEDGKGCWILEVVDEYGNSRVWDDSFPPDMAALTEVKKTILEEGIQSFIG